ncbi:MAG: hypothetical protein KAI83_03735, partial [Thiomargarita sp.]|nr:hypothetical protein [Thiomargarita sp.]
KRTVQRPTYYILSRRMVGFHFVPTHPTFLYSRSQTTLFSVWECLPQRSALYFIYSITIRLSP